MYVVTQIEKVGLRGTAADTLTHSAYLAAKEWVDKLDPRAEYRAVITETESDGIKRARDIFRARTNFPSYLIGRGIEPECFWFQVSQQETRNDGTFWMAGGSRNLHEHQG